MHIRVILVALFLSTLVPTNAPGQQGQTLGGPGAETAQGMLAAQIRLQGFVCDRPLSATRDAKRSRPDYGVWVLRCSNAMYRVRRAPDMSATVERLGAR
jgi:hypothetical protein